MCKPSCLFMCLCLLPVFSWFVNPVFGQTRQRPNIVLIMADDIGYSDIGCYGGVIRTPHLDQLAAGGVRFTQFYNTARCCPTRAALLTGLYPHQAGIGHMMDDRGMDGYRGDLNRRCVTIAEAIKPAGYRNYMLGKWHVTKKVNPKGDAERHNWPLQRGFDRFYGTIHGAGSFFDPNSLVRDNAIISPFADSEYPSSNYYYTDAISDQAARFIADHRQQNASQPFFMYVAYTAPHWPMHAKSADIDKYRGVFDLGYDAIRAGKFERMNQLGLIDARWKMAPQRGGSWSDVPNREFEIRCMEVFAAMVDCMDQGIGRIVNQLARDGLLENTLIMYCQDNGGCAELMGRGGQFKPRGERPTLPALATDYLQPDMIPKQTRDGFPVRQGYGVLPGGPDTYIAYGEAWANVSNTPFREYKHWVHEGGISSPLIAHWPAGIPTARKNALEPQPSHLIDLMATCVDVAGARYPQTFAEHQIIPAEGVSLRPAMLGQPLNRSQPLYWEHEGNRAARDCKWKLVAKGPGGPWELYDIDADRTETLDLARQHPAIVRKMIGQWETWAKRAAVLPWIWKPPYTSSDSAK